MTDCIFIVDRAALRSRRAGAAILAAAALALSGCGGGASAKDGPHPRLVIDQPIHRFELMAIGEERSHTFVLKNEGDAPLSISRTDQTCTCLKLEMSAFEIAPGESARATVTWDIKIPRDPFVETLAFRSNDPAQPQFKLEFHGKSARLFDIAPEIWDLGAVNDETPSEFTGTVTSPVEAFDIPSIACTNPKISAEAVRIPDDERRRLNARDGYHIKVHTAGDAVPPGPIRETLTIRTTLNGGTPFKIKLEGQRPGPFHISGAAWDPKHAYVDLGEFPAETGKTVRLRFDVAGAAEPFQFEDVKIDDDRIEVRLEREGESAPGTGTFALSVEFRKGSPASVRTGKDAATVEVKTNHPRAPKFTFYVSFVAT